MSGRPTTSALPVSHETFRGVVLRETPIKEQDKLLTVLTADHGLVSISAHGARAIKSRNLTATELLCYSEFTVEKKGEWRTLRESTLIENFYGLRSRLESFAFAQYAAQVCADVAVEEDDETELLQLLLNTLFLAEKSEETEKIKATFELRCCAVNGFLPDLGGCAGCGKTEGNFSLDTLGGTLFCENCAEKKRLAEAVTESGVSSSMQKLTPSVLAAMRYVCGAPAKRIYSFTLPENEQRVMSRVCERFLLDQVGHGYDTLTFYRDLKALPETK